MALPEQALALLPFEGLPVLLRVAEIVSPEDENVLAVLARGLANLTFDAEMAGETIRAGGLPALVSMLSSSSKQLQTEATGAILNISAATASEDDDSPMEHADALVACGVIEPLLVLLRCNQNALVQGHVCFRRR